MSDVKVDITQLEKLYREAKNNRVPLEADWFLNLSYYLGNQWVFWNKGRIDKPRLESWRVEFVDNRIRPISIARVAKATKSRPTFVCVPSTADDTDMSNAEIGENVLENKWNVQNLDYKHLLTQFWKEICGAGFWKIGWNSSLGYKSDFLYGEEGFYKSAQGSPYKVGTSEAEVLEGLLSEKGQSFEKKSQAQGDLCIEVMSPFELFPDPIATCIDDCGYMVEEKIRSKEEVASKYDDNNVQEDAAIPIGIVESRQANLSANQGKDSAKGVRVFEVYIKPNRKYPKGLWAVWYNKKIKFAKTLDESPYVDFPYVMFSADLVPGRFWPATIISQLRGPQTDLNKIQSQIRENAIRIGNPAIAISREANVKWTGRIGEKVFYNDVVQNPLPQFISPPEIPVYVREEVERIEKSITEISGIHDISQGTVPSGITAASAINLLQEADDTRLGPEIQLMEKSLAIAGTTIIKVLAKFANDQRIIRLAGQDGAWDIKKWKGEMLSKIIGVEVQAGSGMPQSKAARQAAAQELLSLGLQYGVPINQRAMRRFFKDYELGGLDRLFMDLENDESQITRENRRLYNDEMFAPNEFDDDQLHIEGHEEEMKTAKWEMQPDEVKGKFIAHWKLHKEKQMAAVNAQVQKLQEEQAAQVQGEQQRELQLVKEKEASKPRVNNG